MLEVRPCCWVLYRLALEAQGGVQHRLDRRSRLLDPIPRHPYEGRIGFLDFMLHCGGIPTHGLDHELGADLQGKAVS